MPQQAARRQWDADDFLHINITTTLIQSLESGGREANPPMQPTSVTAKEDFGVLVSDR
jgi:hypothetical protein